MPWLALNAGSSSLKFSLIDRQEHVWAHGAADFGRHPTRYTWWAERNSPTSAGQDVTDVIDVSWSGFKPAVQRIVGDVRALARTEPAAAPIDAVVHRVVHGGTRFTQPVRVTREVRADLDELTELAPLHNPPGLEVIDASLEALPETPHVAVFDTAFHATLSPEAFTYPLPLDLTKRWGLRRFGFHGLSHAYSAERAAQMLGRAPGGLRVVIAHLGSGASVTATRDGKSVDTSMGFTPLEGLMMGTRSGSIDPGLLLHLQLQHGMPAEDLQRILNHESGLLGMSGSSADMRDVIEASQAGDTRATLAFRVYAHRARQAIGASAVTLGGIDALVFTGGIGENSALVREAVCAGLSCLGLELHRDVNASARPDAVLSSHESHGRILAIAAREDLMMARGANQVTRGRGD